MSYQSLIIEPPAQELRRVLIDETNRRIICMVIPLDAEKKRDLRVCGMDNQSPYQFCN